MKPNEAIIILVNSINNDRRDLFYKAVNDYLATLAKNGDQYYRLNSVLKQKPLKMTLLDNLASQLKHLISQPVVSDEYVFINENSEKLFSSIIEEHKNKEAFGIHNIPIRSKMLFYGHTGNGKTTIAKAFSKLAGLPFVEVNSDNLIDAHLGSTSANINKVFSSIQEPCVLFWDEIDSIGKKRGDGTSSAAGHENDRMVNSFLINFEKLKHDIIFIGATNRRDVLDTAFVRRFDVVHEIPPPRDIEKETFAKQLLSYHKLPEASIDVSGFDSYYEIKNHISQMAREFILSKIQ